MGDPLHLQAYRSILAQASRGVISLKTTREAQQLKGELFSSPCGGANASTTCLLTPAAAESTGLIFPLHDTPLNCAAQLVFINISVFHRGLCNLVGKAHFLLANTKNYIGISGNRGSHKKPMALLAAQWVAAM